MLTLSRDEASRVTKLAQAVKVSPVRAARLIIRNALGYTFRENSPAYRLVDACGIMHEDAASAGK